MEDMNRRPEEEIPTENASAPQGETANQFEGGDPSQNTAQQASENSTGEQQGEQPYTGAYSHQGAYIPPQDGYSHGSYQQPYGGQYGGKNYQPNQQYQGYQKKDDEYRWNFEAYDQPQSKPDAKEPGKRRKSKGIAVFTSIICILLVMGVLGFAAVGFYSVVQGRISGDKEQGGGVSQPAVEMPKLNLNDKPEDGQPQPAPAAGTLTAPQIVKKVKPSVVGIVSYKRDGSLTATGQNQGSGIIMSEDGFILTNAHVIYGADGIKVVLNNGEEFSAVVQGIDVKTDLAVIKIEKTGLTYAEFGNSDQIEEGETVLAIGNPGGLQLAGSVSQGVVSGVNREVQTSESGGYTMKCIQTDAAINPGNSGGALVNNFGQVIGINSSKIAATDYEGIGFAIPINEAKPIIDDLMSYGRVTGRVKIGITIDEIDEVAARLNDMPTGILVYNVEPDSDAYKKGVVAGDIITHIDDQRVNTLDDVRKIIDNFKPGDTVKLTVYRSTEGYRTRTLTIQIALMEDLGTDSEVYP